jgi:hypothetical protein
MTVSEFEDPFIEQAPEQESVLLEAVHAQPADTFPPEAASPVQNYARQLIGAAIEQAYTDTTPPTVWPDLEFQFQRRSFELDSAGNPRHHHLVNAALRAIAKHTPQALDMPRFTDSGLGRNSRWAQQKVEELTKGFIHGRAKLHGAAIERAQLLDPAILFDELESVLTTQHDPTIQAVDGLTRFFDYLAPEMITALRRDVVVTAKYNLIRRVYTNLVIERNRR